MNETKHIPFGWGEKIVRGCTVKAVREMPRPCVEDCVQAQGILPISKSSITSLSR